MKIIRDLTTLAMLLLTVCLSASAQTTTIEQQRKVIAELERRIANEEKQLKSLKQSKDNAEKRINSLTRQIEYQNTLIRETTQQIKRLTAEVEASEKRLLNLSGEQSVLEENTKRLAQAAYRNYRYQDQLAYIFSAESFTEMARRVAMLRVATEHRLAQIEKIIEVRKNVQAEREALAKRREELSATKRRLDSHRKKLNANMASAKRTFNTMSSKQQSVMRSKMEHEGKLNAAIKQLQKLIRGNKVGASFSSRTTALSLPVVGGRVKRYKGNMAEIVGKEGSIVAAVYEGKIVDIKRNKVNNKYDVYIAHGEYITSYANLSAVSVKKGAIVQRGQRIGTIGSAVNISTMELEYKIVFGVYAPKPEIVLSAANLFKK